MLNHPSLLLYGVANTLFLCRKYLYCFILYDVQVTIYFKALKESCESLKKSFRIFMNIAAVTKNVSPKINIFKARVDRRDK